MDWGAVGKGTLVWAAEGGAAVVTLRCHRSRCRAVPFLAPNL